MKNKYLVMVLLTALIGASCVSSTNKEFNSKELHAFESASAIVVNPIIENKKVSDSMGRSLTTTLMNHMAADIRYAGDIPQLQTVLTNDNLIADGQVNMKELSKIGNAVKANEVICVKVNTFSLYPPQKMSALVIVRSSEGSKYRQKVGFVNLSLEDPILRKEFSDFVGGEIRNPLEDKMLRTTNINTQTGMLSNDAFSKFVGYKIAKQILYMKKY
ncbi:MAG: hypothetical protein NE328_15445 [Lentisphaeraceae bacterium]|nr:hypothetical protein [Lentisphaeraceae bacterium]